ncbi:thiamine-triphosphatase-like isoform X2 [Saccoglossus kowalevskii]|uniref:Thiamine-triphosphatase n=1 Tax=Saccoglossus kowalevskii TaxID=10224 RepID=A0ABM0H0H4_SACKO|nr:PREDICTED: thiamine-triphosphatase-like isoform X1 [Saccoglossus kowalevskii]
MSEEPTSETGTSKVLELERKFSINENSERKLQEVGASCLREKSFEDSYYDSVDYQLTLSDYWLRKREGNWELKSPPEKRKPESDVAQYIETTNAGEIVQYLSAILKTDPTHAGDNADQIAKFVEKTGLQPFAVFRTNRKTYTMEGGFQIDLDETDFGYKVGEIELIVHQNEDVAAALEKIDTLAEKLEFTNLEAEIPAGVLPDTLLVI